MSKHRGALACALVAFLIGSAAALGETAFNGDMTFENVCTGNASESCYIVAIGTITGETPGKFADYLAEQQHEGNKVLLHSPGGSLLAGLKLGEIIRENLLETRVGIWKPDGFRGDIETGGICASACAYAFLGGTVRQVPEGNRLGFHQFFLSAPRAAEIPPDKLGEALEKAQELSSIVVRYLLEMGIDARIFVLGSGAKPDEMFFPDESQLAEFALVTPHEFGEFYLEPYKAGLVAASKRRGETRLYDTALQVTSYCRDKSPYLLVTAEMVLPTIYTPDSTLVFETSGKPVEIEIASDRLRRLGEHAYEVTLNKEAVRLFKKAAKFEFAVYLSRADGGVVSGEVELTDLDRRILDASFRFCID
ncbi:hypothetical protein FMN50_13250 [Rhodobacterales bacterium]|nr:hypothetical protein FMN50_13250 [Rhodobacterales bacterium]